MQENIENIWLHQIYIWLQYLQMNKFWHLHGVNMRLNKWTKLISKYEGESKVLQYFGSC